MMDESTTVSKTESTSYRKRKKLIMIWLLFVSALVGGISAFIPENSEIGRLTDIVFGIPFLFLAVAWCHYDALERGFFLGVGWKVCLVILFAIAFPVYIFQSRESGGLKALGLSLLFFCAMIVTSTFFALLGYSIGYWLGLIE